LPLPLDDLGLVPRSPGLSLDAIDARFAPLLDALVAAAREAAAGSAATAGEAAPPPIGNHQDPLLGVYLRGSVPRGLFLEGVSDVDAVALVVADDAFAAAAAAAVAERANDALSSDAAAAAAVAELRPTKVELRVQCVPAREAAMLHEAAAAEEGASSPPTSLPPSLVRRALGPTLAFELATSAVTLAAATSSLDLPTLLPDVARLPPAPWLLPTAAADVERAVRAVEGVGAGAESSSAAAAAAAARWALKRCVRAALELQFLSGAAAAAKGGTATTITTLRWTRDLYHCAALTRSAAESGACRLSARVAAAVDEALRMYVELLSLPEGGENDDGLALAACAHARRLADALDAAFLAAMLSEAPGWLTRHVPTPPPTDNGGGGPGRRRRRRAWWPFGGGKGERDDDARAATNNNPIDNIAPPGHSPLFLVGCDPPPVHVRISGPPRLQLDWSDALAAALGAAASSSSSSSPIPQRPQQPVLLRGFAKRWPAAQRWSFWALLMQGGGGDDDGSIDADADANANDPRHEPLRGKARAAPSLAFPFCEPALRDVLVAARGPAAAPSLEVDGLLASDFVRAMVRQERRSGLPLSTPTPPPPALPPSHPYLYLQAELPEGHPMHDDVRDGLEELRVILSTAAVDAATVRPTQRPRLWASARGSVSPTHYDRDASVLVQVVGRKRMLLFDPDQLECLSPYPEQHLLRRRARVNLAAASAATTTLRSRLEAVEVVLEPGDAVFFPPEWAHYTESLTPSMSVTTRFALGGGGG
jgi:hypothetical protein